MDAATRAPALQDLDRTGRANEPLRTPPRFTCNRTDSLTTFRRKDAMKLPPALNLGRIGIVFVLSLVSPAASFAATASPAGQSAASISGRVQHGATGAYLEGATVTLSPGSHST